jgi:chaperonin GroEL
MVSNVVNKDILTKQIEETLVSISDYLALSLGPNGSTTIIERSDRNHYTTKDGFTILKNIRIGDNIGNTILDLIKRISDELVFKVGDGSTSAIIAAKELYFSLKRFEEKHKLRSKDLIDLLKSCSEDIINGIQQISKKLTIDDKELIKNIAGVSLNNDFHMGSMIQEIYEKITESGFINVKMSDTNKTHYQILNGFELGTGYLDPIFKNSSSGECILKNADVFLIDGKIDSSFIDNLNKILIRYLTIESNPERIPLVIIAGGLDEEAKIFLRRTFLHLQQKEAPKLFNIIIPDIYTDKGRDIFDDLAISLNAHPYKKDLGIAFDIGEMDEMVGKTKEVISSIWTTTIYLNNITSDIHNEILKEKKEEITLMLKSMNDKFDAKSEIEKFHLSKRLAMLEGNRLATIFVGGETDFEKECNKFLIDDAVSACKSAFKYGYVLGCNLAITIVTRSLLVTYMNTNKFDTKSDMLLEIFDAFKRLFITVFKNKYNREEDLSMIEDIFDKCVHNDIAYDLINEGYTDNKIINSAQTDIEILRATVSIISLIYSSNLFISVT